MDGQNPYLEYWRKKLETYTSTPPSAGRTGQVGQQAQELAQQPGPPWMEDQWWNVLQGLKQEALPEVPYRPAKSTVMATPMLTPEVPYRLVEPSEPAPAKPSPEIPTIGPAPEPSWADALKDVQRPVDLADMLASKDATGVSLFSKLFPSFGMLEPTVSSAEKEYQSTLFARGIGATNPYDRIRSINEYLDRYRVFFGKGTIGADVARGLANTIRWGLELALAGPVWEAAAGKITNLVKPSLVAKLGAKLGGHLAEIVGTAAGSGAIQAAWLPAIAGQTAEYVKQGIPLEKAFIRAATEQWIQTFTEGLGEHLTYLTGIDWLTENAVRASQKIPGAGKLIGLMAAFAIRKGKAKDGADFLRQIMDKAKFSGYLGELLEERAADVMSILSGTSPSVPEGAGLSERAKILWQETLDLHDRAVEALVLAIPTGALAVADIARTGEPLGPDQKALLDEALPERLRQAAEQIAQQKPAEQPAATQPTEQATPEAAQVTPTEQMTPTAAELSSPTGTLSTPARPLIEQPAAEVETERLATTQQEAQSSLLEPSIPTSVQTPSSVTGPPVDIEQIRLQAEQEAAQLTQLEPAKLIERLAEANSQQAELETQNLEENLRQADARLAAARPEAAQRAVVESAYQIRTPTGKPISAAHIVRFVNRAFGPVRGMLSLYRKEIKSRGLRGVHYTHGHFIRIVGGRNVNVLAHEVGHELYARLLDRLQSNKQTIPEGVVRSLLQLGHELYPDERDPSALLSEGFAQLIRGILGAPDMLLYTDVRTRFADTMRWALRMIGTSPDAKAFEQLAKLYERYWSQGPLARLAGFTSGAPTDLLDRIKSGLHKIRGAVDHFYILQQFSKLYEEATGKPLPPSKDPFIWAISIMHRTAAIARQMVSRCTIDKDGRATGDGLKQVLAKIPKHLHEDFWLYAAARVMSLRIERGIKQGMEVADLDAVLSYYRDKGLDGQFEAGLKAITAWSDRVLDYAIQCGALSEEERRAMRAANPVWLYFVRAAMDYERKPANVIKVRALAQGLRPTLEQSGSEVELMEIPKALEEFAFRVVLAANKAWTMNLIRKLATEVPLLNRLVQEIPAPKMPYPVPREYLDKIYQTIRDVQTREVNLIWEQWRTSGPDVLGQMARTRLADAIAKVLGITDPDKIKAHLANKGARLGERTLKRIYNRLVDDYCISPNGFMNLIRDRDMGQFFIPMERWPGWENVVTWVDPSTKRRVWAEVDQDLVQVLEGVNRLIPTNQFVRLASLATRLVRLGAVELNPSFGWGRNLIRDMLTYLPKTQSGRFIPPIFQALAKGMRIKLTPEQERYVRLVGGIPGLLQTGTPATLDLGEGFVARYVEGPLQALEQILSAPEMAWRLQELQDVYNKRKAEGWSDEDAFHAAMVAADEVTTPFQRVGYHWFSTFCMYLIPFWSANINGPLSTMRVARKQPARFFTAGIAYLTIPAIIEWLTYKDEPWYKSLTPQERCMYFHVQIPGTKTVLRLPLPWEMGWLFAAVPKMILDYSYRHQDERIWQDLRVGVSTLNPFDWPALIEPMIRLALNTDRLGRPIVTEKMRMRLPEDRYRKYTPQLSRDIAHALNTIIGKEEVSPVQLDYLLSGYTGGLYSNTISVLELLRSQRSFDPSDLPVIGTFVLRLPSRPAAELDAFYDELTRLNQAYVSRRISAADVLRRRRYQEAERQIRATSDSFEQGKIDADTANRQISSILKDVDRPLTRTELENILRQHTYQSSGSSLIGGQRVYHRAGQPHPGMEPLVEAVRQVLQQEATK